MKNTPVILPHFRVHSPWGKSEPEMSDEGRFFCLAPASYINCLNASAGTAAVITAAFVFAQIHSFSLCKLARACPWVRALHVCTSTDSSLYEFLIKCQPAKHFQFFSSSHRERDSEFDGCCVISVSPHSPSGWCGLSTCNIMLFELEHPSVDLGSE